ncbi:hypothetical protein B0H19DRAFT_840911, partial [Mycena capillaripes]
SKVVWQYNYDSVTSNIQSFTEYVPMLHDINNNNPQRFDTNVPADVSRFKTLHVLAFNEPDEDSVEGQLTPEDAADAWLEYINFLKASVRLGSPAVTSSSDSGRGLDWLASFKAIFESCTIDFYAVHWYGVASAKPSDLESFVASACTLAAGKPVWVTEFGLTGATANQTLAFVQAVLPLLDANSCVERYAYGTATDLVVNGGPTLTTLGQVYALS